MPDLLGDIVMRVSTETRTGADNLKWEVAKKANLGIDAKFFHDKLSLTVDIFRDTRDHIFQDRVTLPSYVGMVTYPKSRCRTYAQCRIGRKY